MWIYKDFSQRQCALWCIFASVYIFAEHICHGRTKLLSVTAPNYMAFLNSYFFIYRSVKHSEIGSVTPCSVQISRTRSWINGPVILGKPFQSWSQNAFQPDKCLMVIKIAVGSVNPLIQHENKVWLRQKHGSRPIVVRSEMKGSDLLSGFSEWKEVASCTMKCTNLWHDSSWARSADYHSV